MGFYEKAEQWVPVRVIRIAADVPESDHSALEIHENGHAGFSGADRTTTESA